MNTEKSALDTTVPTATQPVAVGPPPPSNFHQNSSHTTADGYNYNSQPTTTNINPTHKENIHVTRSDPLATSSSAPLSRGLSNLKKRSSQYQHNHQPHHTRERRARWIRDKMNVNNYQNGMENGDDDSSLERDSRSKYYGNSHSQLGRTITDSGFQDQSRSRSSSTAKRRSKYHSNSGEDPYWFLSEKDSKGSKFHTSFDQAIEKKPAAAHNFREQRSWNQAAHRRRNSDWNRERLRAGLSLPAQNSLGTGTRSEYLSSTPLHHRDFLPSTGGDDHFDDEEDHEDHEEALEEKEAHSYLSRQTRLPYPYCNLRNHNSHDIILHRSRSQSPCSITSESAESQGEKALDPPRLSIPKGGVGVGAPLVGGGVGLGGGAGLLGPGGSVVGGGYGNGRRLSVLFSSYDAWNEDLIVQSFKELSPSATSVFEAAWTGNLECLEEILTDPENLRKLQEGIFRDNEGRTPLHLASACGHVPCVELLISKGAEVNSCDSNEKATPLSCAASCGSDAVVQVLLEHKADVNAGYEHGKTALHWAIQAGAVDCAKILLEAGAKQNPPLVYSETPLHIAAALGDPISLQLLLDYKADVNLCKGTNRSTALHLSAEEGSASCIRLLLKAGASHTAKDIRGHTALHVAATCDADCLVALLSAGADPNSVDANGRTPLHCAVARGSRAAECVRLLVESGADIDAQDNYGYTPLHLSAVNESSQCASILLHHGSDVTLKTNAGTNALSLLVRRIPDVMRYLVERLDSAVTIHDHDPADPDCEIRLDFRAIVPSCEKRSNGKMSNGVTTSFSPRKAGARGGSQGGGDKDYFSRPHKETEFLTCLVAAGNKKILAHPLSEAFLTLKWRRVRKFFWASLLFQIALVALFTTYVVEVYLIRCPYQRHHENPSSEPVNVSEGIYDGGGVPPPPVPDPYSILNGSNYTPTATIATIPSSTRNPKMDTGQTPNKRTKRSSSDFSWFGVVPPRKHKHGSRQNENHYEKAPDGTVRPRMGTRININIGQPLGAPEAPIEPTVDPSSARMEPTQCEFEPFLQVIWIMLVVFTSLMAIKEIFQLLQSPVSYVMSSENWGQWLLISSVSMTAWSAPEFQLEYWQYPAAACGIFLAWGLMLLQVGRFPALGLYVQMLGKVAANFGLFISAYACLLIAFALAFCVLFHEHPPYSSVALSVLKVFTMMVGEVDYEDLFFNEENVGDPTLFPITAHFLYSSFVLIVTIVLMNLLVGLAVHDIQGLQKGAKLNRLSRQTALISRLESFIFSKRLQSILPSTVGSILQKSALLVPSSYNWSFYFRPNDPRDKRLPKEIKLASLRLASLKHSSTKAKSHAYHQQHSQQGIMSHGDNIIFASRPLSTISKRNSALSHNPEVAVRRLEQRLDQLQTKIDKTMMNVSNRMDAMFNLLLEGKVPLMGDIQEENSLIDNDNVFLGPKSPSTSSSVTFKTPTFSVAPSILKDVSCEKG